MDDIFSLSLFNKQIFINPSIGSFSYNYKDVNTIGYIDYENEFSNYSPTSITICINVCDDCNLNCNYCFNKTKKTQSNKF